MPDRTPRGARSAVRARASPVRYPKRNAHQICILVHNKAVSVQLGCDWQFADDDGRRCDRRLFAALAAIREHGSLQQAARALGLSYRYLWGQLHGWTELFGGPLVRLEKGRGARLTTLGEGLLQTRDQVDGLLAERLSELSAKLTGELRTLATGRIPVLRLCASHDLLIARLRELAENAGTLALEVRFMGSLDSLAAMTRGECDLAGFHVANFGLGPEAKDRITRLLRPKRHRVVELMRREQGLIVARGAPVRALTDLLKRGMRFVNRQAGSGTRLLLDGLLRREGIAASAIRGYEHEEFTHGAVAATVAAGTAEAGFGIRAAAAQYKLDFVPLASERYFLGGRADAFEAPAFPAFVKLLRSRACRAVVRELPGYTFATRMTPGPPEGVFEATRG